MKVVQFLGYKDSGKTRAVSYVARELTRRGLKVGTVKHVHDKSFTMDTKGKDTWVHASSGARVVAAVAPNELSLIKKMDTSKLEAQTLLRPFHDSGIDFVLVEGYSGFQSKVRAVQVICAKSKHDAVELMKLHGEPLCLIGKLEDGPALKRLGGVPVLRLPRDIGRLIGLLAGPTAHQGEPLQRMAHVSGPRGRPGY